jgi:hypothetical protein
MESKPLRALPDVRRRASLDRAARLSAFLRQRGEPLRVHDLDRASQVVIEMVWSIVQVSSQERAPLDPLADDVSAAIVGYLGLPSHSSYLALLRQNFVLSASRAASRPQQC